MPCLFAARRRELESTQTCHGSAIMLPGGAVRARLYDSPYRAQPVDLVAVYGEDLRFFWNDAPLSADRPMAFSDLMSAELAKLSAAVIGCSGTGSVVAEQLLRMGFGHVLVIDHDRITPRNLNRILNSTHKSAGVAELKVEMFRRVAATIRPTARITAVPLELGTVDGILAAAEAVAAAV
jgi:hypothetical protein